MRKHASFRMILHAWESLEGLQMRKTDWNTTPTARKPVTVSVVGGDEDHRVKEIQTDRHGKVEDLDRLRARALQTKDQEELALDIGCGDTK